MAKLKDKLEKHRTAFLQKQMEGEFGDSSASWTAWFLNMVVFPSLKDIADRIDAIETSRKKRMDDE